MDFLESLKQIKQEMKKDAPQNQSKSENKTVEQKQARLEASFTEYIKDSDIKKI